MRAQKQARKGRSVRYLALWLTGFVVALALGQRVGAQFVSAWLDRWDAH